LCRLLLRSAPIAPLPSDNVGVAPGGGNQYRSGSLGFYRGNLEFNQLREGITVYLPVNVPGALLFVGDGHATQGLGGHPKPASRGHLKTGQLKA
jgi:amidase